MDRRWVVGLAVLVGIPILVVVTVTLNGMAGSFERPEPGVGDVVQIVGGGDLDDPALGSIDRADGQVDAREVRATGIVAMAATPTGTLWLVHRDGRVYRVGVDGRVALAIDDDDAPPIGRHAALAIAPYGDLLLVTDGGDTVDGQPVRPTMARVDPSRRNPEWEEVDLSAMPDGVALTGIATASDGRIFLADGHTGIVYEREGAAVQPVAGTGDLRCVAGRQADPPTPINLALTDTGHLVVADRFCLGLYSPTTDVTVAGLTRCPGSGSPTEAADAGSVVEAAPGQLVIAGWFCPAVWAVDETGVASVLLSADDFDQHVEVVDADSHGHLYLLDPEEGVFVLGLPPPNQPQPSSPWPEPSQPSLPETQPWP